MSLKKVNKHNICNLYYGNVIKNFSKKSLFYIYNQNKFSYKFASYKVKKYIRNSSMNTTLVFEDYKFQFYNTVAV